MHHLVLTATSRSDNLFHALLPPNGRGSVVRSPSFQATRRRLTIASERKIVAAAVVISWNVAGTDKKKMANVAENQQEHEAITDRLPKVVPCGRDPLFRWKGFWLPEVVLKSAMAMRTGFEIDGGDVFLTSFPKTGTTWLKAIIHTILNHSMPPPGTAGSHSGDDAAAAADPLVSYNPHELVRNVEYELFGEDSDLKPVDKPLLSTRMFHTHLPYELLPESVQSSSSCKIVYVARNPADTFVSWWHFINRRIDGRKSSLEEEFSAFCEGTEAYGPYLDHVLGYWKEREKIFFITYEELQEDPHKHVERLSRFLGSDLSEEEVKNIVWRCSFDSVSNVKANKGREDVHWTGFPYDSFFRRGIVGDWKNYLSAEMIQRLQGITSEKLQGFGLQFKWEMETTATGSNGAAQ
ncbi:cytosolic sulfotransferase 17-like [Aristolochia californica]|uniref:cytosolic sulfotransferase 17-like n=1 Tax=Aristolochia californica TaxID=171875 RepID=UPI0035DAB206